MKATRFLALYDIHIGCEFARTRGERITRPTHNLAALRATMRFAVDYQPEVFILGGDQLNCGPVSRWHKGYPRLATEFSLKDEMDLLWNEVIVPVENELNCEKKVWIYGNHEHWIELWLDEQPAAEGLIEPHNYYGLEGLGWVIREQGEWYKLGKLHFLHGDVLRGSGATAAQRAVATYRRNIRIGHFHTEATATDKTIIDAEDFHTCKIVPALSRRGPSYQKNAPDNFMQGFLVGEVYPNGDFQDHVVIINKDHFHWNGKLYDGRKMI